MNNSDDVIASRLLLLLEQRSADASICPSDVARSLEQEESRWRALMPDVRRIASAMAAAQVIEVTQGDARIELSLETTGPIRLRRGKRFKRI